MNLLGKKYFWTYGRTQEGKSVLLGPYNDEAHAERMAEKLEDSQVIKLDTKNTAAASRQVKAKLAERPGMMSQVVRRFKHKPKSPSLNGDQLPTMTPLDAGIPDLE